MYLRSIDDNEVKSLPITITTEASDKFRFAWLSCIHKMTWHVQLIWNVVGNVHIFIDGVSSQFRLVQDLFFNFWSKFICKRISRDITINVVMEKPTEWYWGNSKKNCTYKGDIWSPHNRYTLPVCLTCQRNLWIHITLLYTSVDHLLEKSVNVKNAKPIPDMIQVHKACRLMDISCITIDFFRLSSDVDPYYTQWYSKTCDHKVNHTVDSNTCNF